MSTIAFIGLIGIIVGACLLLFALLGWRMWSARHERERVRASGTVVGHAHTTDGSRGGRPLCWPVVRFQADEREYRLEWKSIVAIEDWPIGTPVEVLYDPDHPEHFHLDSEEDANPAPRFLRTGVIVIACALLLMSVTGGSVRNSFANLFATREKKPTKVFTPEAPTGHYSFSFNGVNSFTLTGYVGTDTVVDIPSLTGGNVVSDIAATAFATNYTMRELSVPGTVHNIPGMTFTGCVALSKVTLGNGVQIIGERAFEGCILLEDVTLPASLIVIAENAFPAECKATFHVVEGSAAADYCAAMGYAVEISPADGA